MNNKPKMAAISEMHQNVLVLASANLMNALQQGRSELNPRGAASVDEMQFHGNSVLQKLQRNAMHFPLKEIQFIQLALLSLQADLQDVKQRITAGEIGPPPPSLYSAFGDMDGLVGFTEQLVEYFADVTGDNRPLPAFSPDDLRKYGKHR